MKYSVLIAAAISLSGCAAQVTGDQSSRFIAAGMPVGDFSVPITTVSARRFTGVIRQRFDFSCGSAALATLLRYHYDYDVAEDKAFRGMWTHGDQDAIRRAGFSLLDMKRWLASRGIVANGYKVTLDQIAQTGVPGIALIAIKNYRHFVVVKGVREDEVLLGDPSAGLTVMPREEFAAQWNGVYFVISGERERAKSNFNRPAQWASYSRSPVGNAFSDPVGLQALLMTAPYFGEI